MEREFIFERETKHTYRFKEVPSFAANNVEDDILIGTIYVQKHCFDKKPEIIKVKVEVVK